MVSISKHSKIFLILFVLLLISSTAFATRFGERYCYRSGSQWYCARYDNASFNSGNCAGTVPAPHINLESFRGSTSGFSSSALVNWHVGWKTIKGQQCVIAYEESIYKRNPKVGCIKVCYNTKNGQAGDMLKPIGFPDAMKYQSDVSNTLRRLQLQPGTSPYSQTVASDPTATWIVVGLTFVLVLLIVQRLMCVITRSTC